MGERREANLSSRRRAQQMVLGVRLQAVREKLGLTKPELGPVIGCVSCSMVYKLEVGLVRITGLRLEVLEALEAAVARTTDVWGPKALTTRQRLTRIFALAYPDEARRVA